MTKLDINNMLVGNLIAQIAPIVERETGWSLDLPDLSWRVLPKSRGYEEIVQRRLRNAGVAVEENARSLPRSKPTSWRHTSRAAICCSWCARMWMTATCRG